MAEPAGTRMLTVLHPHNAKHTSNGQKRTLLAPNYHWDATANLSSNTHAPHIGDHNENANFKETFTFLNLREHPDCSSYSHLLQACTKKKSLPQGKLIHAHIVQAGFAYKNMFLDNSLLNMYAKCGSMVNALKVFEDMPERNVVSWSVMISAFSKCGHHKQALALFQQMKRCGIQPDRLIFAIVLPAVGGSVALEHGKEVHGNVIARGFQWDISVDSALVDMYAKCGSIEDAWQMFDKMPKRNVVSYNIMIAGYMRNGCIEKALELFEKMPEKDVVSWTSMVSGYAQNGLVDPALELFWKMPYQNVVSWNAMIGSLVQNGHFEKAVDLFEKMPERNVVSWNTMISGFVQNGQFDEALKLFQSMPERNVVSWTAVIVGYSRNGDIREAFNAFKKMPLRNVISWNAMIAGFAQNGFLDEALQLFHKVPEPNVISWNEIIDGLAKNGCFDQALELFWRIPERNVVSWTALIVGYAQNGHCDKALELFQKMPERNVVSWNAMIAGLAQNGHFYEALKLFWNMHAMDVKPDSDTYSNVLSACANLAALSQGKMIHQDIIRNGFRCDVFMVTALVDMYAKCGTIEDAHKVFDEMYVHNVASWNALILGYAVHGCGKEALNLFEEMQLSGTNPDHVTFVAVLSACCHAGLVNDGMHHFYSMTQYHHILPTVDHYCCMVDLLGRAGHLDEAHEFIKKMPIKPNAAVWASLLGSCRIHVNVDLGEYVAEHLFQFDPANAAYYLLLSSIYAAAGRQDDVENARKMMKERNTIKNPGCSWIDFNGKVAAFLVGEG